MSEWKPIDTAPKDGTPVMCRWRGAQAEKMHEGICAYRTDYWPMAKRERTGWWIADGGIPVNDPHEWKD